MHIVPLTHKALVGELELGHQKQTDALDPRGSVLDTGKHHVNDVLAHVMLTVSDVDLGAKEQVVAVCRLLRTGLDEREVRACLGFGQIHGAAPLATHQVGQKARLQLRRTGNSQGLNGTIGEQWAQRKAHVGRIEHLGTSRRDAFCKTLATKLLGVL